MSTLTTATPIKPQRASFGDHFSTFGAMVRKELTIVLRYPLELLASFGQVFLILLIFVTAGFMFSPGGLDAAGSGVGAGSMPYGFLIFMFVSDTFWTIGYNIRHEQKQGTLEHLYMSPASKFASLLSRVVVMVVWTGSLSILALTLIGLLFGALPTENMPLALLVMLFTLSGTIGLGFAFAGLTLSIKETAQTVANLVQFAFIVVCAPFFPFAVLPGPVQFISRLVPLSYGVDAFRSLLVGLPNGTPELAPLWVELIIIVAFGVLMPILGFWIYSRAEDAARRSGSLSEY